MKKALLSAWKAAGNNQMRDLIEVGYLYLSNFQDGIGDKPIDPTLPPDCSPEKMAAILDPFIAHSQKVQIEQDALLIELNKFKKWIADR